MASQKGPALNFDPIAEARAHWRQRWPEAERMAAATALIRVQRIVMIAVEAALEPFGLTFSRYEALVLLAFTRQGRLPLGKLGVRLQVHPTSVTNAIDRLESQGLVRRIGHPSDRRTTLAEITTEGRAIVERATEAVAGTHFGLGALDGSELEELMGILMRVRQAAGDFDPTPVAALPQTGGPA